STVAGLVLDTVTRGRREMKLIAYLEQPPPAEEGSRPPDKELQVQRAGRERRRIARACPHQRYRAGLGHPGSARRRAHPASRARSEHERAGGLDRYPAASRTGRRRGRVDRAAAA